MVHHIWIEHLCLVDNWGYVLVGFILLKRELQVTWVDLLVQLVDVVPFIQSVVL